MQLTIPIVFSTKNLATLLTFRAVCENEGITTPVLGNPHFDWRGTLSRGETVSVGNFGTDIKGGVYGRVNTEGFVYHGYNVADNAPAVTYLSSIDAFIALLDSLKTKRFRLYVREIRVVPVEIEANSLEDAQEKWREGDGEYLIAQSRHSCLSTEDYFDIFGEREGEEIE